MSELKVGMDVVIGGMWHQITEVDEDGSWVSVVDQEGEEDWVCSDAIDHIHD